MIEQRQEKELEEEEREENEYWTVFIILKYFETFEKAWMK